MDEPGSEIVEWTSASVLGHSLAGICMSRLILFVDDDRLAAQTLCAALRDHEFTVDYVASVPEALSCVQRHAYDLAIVDLMMPSGGLGFVETRGGFETGIALADAFVKRPRH